MSESEHGFGNDVLIAGEKLRSFTANEAIDQHQAVKLTGDFSVNVAGAGEAIFGVAAYDVADGQELDVIMDDCEVNVVSGDVIAAGAELEVDADGNFVPLDAGIKAGVALESAGDGDVFQAYLTDAGGNE